MRRLLSLGMLVFSPLLWAECSEDYAGLAVINEVSDTENFIEVKVLSSAIDASVYGDWTLSFCSSDGKQNPTIQCSGERRLDLADSTGFPWLVMDSTDLGGTDVDLRGIEIRLSDVNGNTIDYLRVADLSDSSAVADVSTLEDTTCEIVSVIDAGGGNSGKLTMREPDGAGDWNLDPGKSGPDATSGDTNDGGGTTNLPQISINNPVVSRGNPAVFTISLSTAPAGPLEITYETRNGSAVASSDYSAVSGSLVFGTDDTSKSLSVDTGGTPADVAETFYLVLGVPTLEAGETFGGTFVSQVGIGEISPSNPATTLAGFEFVADAAASVCTPHSVTISAINDNGDVMTGYDGAVRLSTSSGHGTWNLEDGQGALAPEPDSSDDGSVFYDFVASDGGEVRFQLSNTHADILTVTVLDETLGVSGTSNAIEFLENVLRITSKDGLGDDLIAGRRHQYRVDLLKRDDTGDCTVAEDYQGTYALQAWLDRTAGDPGGLEPSLTSANTLGQVPDVAGPETLEVTFTKGVGTFSLLAPDVGQYTLRLLDSVSGYAEALDGSPIPIPSTSAGAPWTVRPFAVAIRAPGNPGATDASGPIFKSAGEAFTIEAKGVLYNAADDSDGDGQADPGSNLWDNIVAPSFGQEGETVTVEADLRAPLPGNNPGLVGTTNPLSTFTNGVASTAGLSFPEVGVIALSGRITDGSYLGAGPARTQKMVHASGPVGRFIPSRLDLDLLDEGTLSAACTAGTTDFSYTGQDFEWLVPPRFQVTPINVEGNETENYLRGDFMKLSATGFARTWPLTDEAATLSGGSALAPLVSSTGPGLIEARADGNPIFYRYSGSDLFRYSKTVGAAIVPFSPVLNFGVSSVSDADGVTWSAPTTVTAPAPSAFIPSAPGEIRYGRLQMQNVYGPENVDELLMPFSAEYWDGSRFVTNTDDSCTPWSTANITDPQAYHSLVADSGSLAAGVGGPLVLEPNGDRGTDTLIWDMPIWLEGDWDQDGALEDPSATATFGVFRGNDRIVYWRER
ncbi:Calx-beta domain-containing protein [Marinobacter pelagius]|uniref:Calx-beta domain-containing protein n=1 Tax=Marinobacter pelagius TaxID=379482 RepID=A0A366G2S7_9GAMM|nr:DUF6701 domain-containing protein [Marinobacter pelagius]RBP20550.1 Calx-beta domain-containing protein [Marinobacter pelagius]